MSARADEKLDAYHYIGYVPAHGRVWELDGLRTAGPLDVGEIDSDDPTSRAGWMDVVRPALQRRMQTVLQSGAEHIQYNLLAIVDDQYLRASDELEILKRERAAIERRLAQSYAEGWTDKVRGCPPATRGSVAEALTSPSIAQVDPALLASASEAFATTLRPRAQEAGKVFAPGFGARKMEKELAILDMPERKLAPAWEDCVRAALSAKVAVEEETEKSRRAQVRAFFAPLVSRGLSRMRCGRRSTSTEVQRRLTGPEWREEGRVSLLCILFLARVAFQYSAHGGRFATRTRGSGLRFLLILADDVRVSVTTLF